MPHRNERETGSRSTTSTIDRPSDRNTDYRRRQALERRHPWSDFFDRLPFGFWAPPTGLTRPSWSQRGGSLTNFNWSPEIESFQRGDEFVVRADLPGLEKKDVTVEVEDAALVIQGERSNEHKEEREGYYSTERSYGEFCRIVPLPEGAITDSVKASFKNGVLEVTVKAPPHEVNRGRRIEIS